MKSYLIKIYRKGAYIDTIVDFEFNGFSKQKNGGLGEMSFVLAKKWDDFGEGYLIAHNNEVELYCADKDSGSDGLLIYSGYISRYSPRISGSTENVTVYCKGYGAKAAMSILKSAAYIELKTHTTNKLYTGTPASACLISEVVKKIIDLHRAESLNAKINYDANSIEETTGASMTYTFNAVDYIKAINKCLAFAPANWWWYIGADNILQFRAKPAAPKHRFIFGKDFKELTVDKDMEPVINRYLFSSYNDGTPILKLYSDTDSGEAFDDRWDIITDDRVKDLTSANLRGQSGLTENKLAKVKTKVVILDNNGANDGYDIESIEPGDTCSFINFDEVTSQTFVANMSIESVQYTPDYAVLEVEELAGSVAEIIVSAENRISEQEATNRPTSYTT